MGLTFEDIDYMKNNLENDVFDQKSIGILSEPQHLASEMVSFGNNKFFSENFGGIIVVGIDKDGNYEDFVSKQAHEEFVMNIARDKIIPPMKPKFELVESTDGKKVYVITIPKMVTTPYGLKTDEGSVYKVRAGSTVRTASPEELSELHLVTLKPENSFKNQQVETIESEFPKMSINPSFRLTIIPIDMNQRMIEFNIDNTEWIKSKIPKYTHIRSVTLSQNEIHYDSKTRPSPDSALFVLNEYGSFSAIEFINNYQDKLGSKTVIMGRQIVLLSSLLNYIKEVYDKFAYSGRISIKLQFNSVQGYNFKDYNVDDPFHFVEKQFLKSDVTINREISLKSWNLRSLVESIFDEICKACDWILEKSAIHGYFEHLKSKGFPIE
ncbi:MAG: putative DNA binding domain-containing protein [Thaumarchaeota archaeon]|nr:putative DNA binding domain-containing protein [Nitrososphaerota archaeon]